MCRYQVKLQIAFKDCMKFWRQLLRARDKGTEEIEEVYSSISGMIGKPFTEHKTPVLKNRSWRVKLTTDGEEIHNITNIQSLRNCMSISFSS